MKQLTLKILKKLLVAIVAFAATPAMAGTQTGGPGIQQGPVIGTGTRVLEKPNLVARLGAIFGRTGLNLYQQLADIFTYRRRLPASNDIREG